MMDPTLARLLAPALVDPGNLTPDDLARHVNREAPGTWSTEAARHAVKLARRRGEVAASLLRLTDAGEEAADEYAGSVEPMLALQALVEDPATHDQRRAEARDRLRDMQAVLPLSSRRLLETLRTFGPLTLAEVARLCGSDSGPSGATKGARDLLVSQGWAWPPTCVVLTELGEQRLLACPAGAAAVQAERAAVEGFSSASSAGLGAVAAEWEEERRLRARLMELEKARARRLAG